MRIEADMKKGIIDFLRKDQNCKNILNEVDSGYGIADFVGLKSSPKRHFFYFKNKIDIFFLQKMNIHQPVSIDEIEENVHYSRKYLKNVVLKIYKEQGLLDESEGNLYKRVAELNFQDFLLTAVEAKLSKWKQALKQAIFYKKFADYSFVALYKKFIKNVDFSMFEDNNIGLVSIDDNLNFKLIIKPELNRDFYEESKLFVSGLTLQKRIKSIKTLH